MQPESPLLIRRPWLWLTVALVGVAVFAALADSVKDHLDEEDAERLAEWDVALLAWLAPRVGPTLLSVALVLDHIGGTIAVMLVLLVVSALLWRRGLHHHAAFVVVSSLVLTVLVFTLKAAFGRPRPENALLDINSGAFPSGHSAYGAFLAALLLWFATNGVRERAATWALGALALAWSVAMAASRVVLGVHYLTDVVAGAALGVAVVGGGLAAVEVAHRVKGIRRAT